MLDAIYKGLVIYSHEGSTLERKNMNPGTDDGCLIKHRAFWVSLAGNEVAILEVKNSSGGAETLAAYKDDKGMVSILKESGKNETEHVITLKDTELYSVDINSDGVNTIGVSAATGLYGSGASKLALKAIEGITGSK